MIKFGTDGWRAVISEEFTFENVRIVAQAIADYVLSSSETKAQIVIGYDTRFLSDMYARECARVLAANGIRVMLADRVTPTPALSYAVKKYGAAGGIMITASHNPYRYNGIKYKAGYGGSALPDMTNKIEERLYRQPPRLIDFNAALEEAVIRLCNFAADYLGQLRCLVDTRKIAGSGLGIVVDSMHGAGAGYIKQVLAEDGLEVTEIRGKADPLFGGINPEPIRKNLQALADEIQRIKAAAGFATDGDGDRVGAIDADGRYINSHIIYALLLRYLVDCRKWTGGVVKTFSTSRMIDLLAAKHNLPVFETPIGFKYICELFLQEDILLGGEESGGIGFKNHIPERDGILATLLLLEMMAVYGKSLGQLVVELMQEIGCHCYNRVDLRLTAEVRDKGLKDLRINPPDAVGGISVREVLTLDGIKYILADGSWVLFRGSGTEPLVRIYAEAGSNEAVESLLDSSQILLTGSCSK